MPAVVYALVGTSRHVSTGPESTTAVMVAVAVAPLADLREAGADVGEQVIAADDVSVHFAK